MHLGVLFPSSQLTVWADSPVGSHIALESFTHLARTAERGCFDFLILADHPRQAEHLGEFFELGVAGEPDQITLLSAVAASTSHLGLVATVNATFNEPFDIARRLSTLDRLSGGRAGWNVVTTSDAATGANFRRGGYLPHADRYRRAAEFVDVTRKIWAGGRFEHHGPQFSVSGEFAAPPSPQGTPLMLQAGMSEQGREFGAAYADVVYSGCKGEAGRAFYRDLRPRFARHGRTPKVMPGVSFVLGDSPEEARENARAARLQEVCPRRALWYLERFWGRDLSTCDPDGPLPDLDPDLTTAPDPVARATRIEKWRALAAEQRLSIRELVLKLTDPKPFTGTPRQVAAAMDDYVRGGGSDGFILVPRSAPRGLDEFVAKVVPELRDRGALRPEYSATTLRGHLGS
ncbi:Flavin-dependent oxidoreductase, luciferase family (includes alkanesulfonate monooxygenase SsuD and methylene tetrahydromethanopterin reductase) [Amycolatopsis xylanica]|uniref:Flavin-dependent oxidoreductase, luciferase family (Includes alkanesulfonate monooxygenase SsuD and methylene tetrahydromethanopterin reductase) n=1 Tax=Amycolatopsis xylanica TaxID=589385 RepID=A0A1H3PJY2_9PSEU|nr:LLM class flavin-dependent oxidoreductase [Amycolatopsis xylanica]SDZ01350.1 Flavin-dependent oxidoreductase, luciferase family (includes alkanesulfonate monooxygenase SsuD and methylene tetrahydromethanopterin reductase) [Amycolatopsis xylanica]